MVELDDLTVFSNLNHPMILWFYLCTKNIQILLNVLPFTGWKAFHFTIVNIPIIYLGMFMIYVEKTAMQCALNPKHTAIFTLYRT